MRRLAIVGALMAGVGCSEPHVEIVCLTTRPAPEGGYFRSDIGVSVDGRVAFSEDDIYWFWADSGEPIHEWRLQARIEKVLDAKARDWFEYLGDDAPPEMGPLPPCVQSAVQGEPHEECCDDTDSVDL